MNQLIPVDVVVDTWNLRGQACDVLGANRFPTVDGIETGLRKMGFKVNEVYAAVACEPYSDSPSPRVQQALKSTERFTELVNGHSRGTLLKGRLTDRSGELEEKLVDVLCAVQITRSAMRIATGISLSKAIVVISEDIDLSPAFAMAQELDVPVYAAANETVHTRPGDWLILSDSVMLDFCGRPRGDVGSQRKMTVAKQLMSGTTVRKWEFLYVNNRSNDLVFRHRTGVEGHLPVSEATTKFRTGDSADLFPVDLFVSPSASFPRLRLSVTPPASACPPHLIEGEVVEWVVPTRVRVLKKSTGQVSTFEAAPGSLLPGMPVALYCAPGSRSRLIGSLEKVPTLAGWSSPTEPKIATVQQVAGHRGATVRATVAGLAEPVGLLPPSNDVPGVGDRYAVVPRSQKDGRVTKVLALSTALRSKDVKH